MYLLSDNVLEDYVIKLRRDFHSYPELGGEEYRTSEIVQTELKKLEIPFQTGFAKTGVLGIIKGTLPGPTIGLRADMDALPITELIDHEYVSKIKGKMHACGHDAHTAMLLGVAHCLMGKLNELKGTVLLIFQPSEEVSPTGGAAQMIEDGLFKDYQPDIFLAQHVWPQLPVGQFGVKPGSIMGASDRFEIIITGRGGHASMPHQTIDSIVVANQVINCIQTIVSRNINPLKEAVITIGKITAGERYNVIADKAYLEGTVRTLDLNVKKQIVARLRQVVEHTCEAMGAEVSLKYIDGYQSTVNDENVANFVRETIINEQGLNSCPSIEPNLGGEDFSRFLQKSKGVYYWLGVGGTKGDYPPLHNPYFNIDERALRIGYTTMGNLALKYSQQ